MNNGSNDSNNEEDMTFDDDDIFTDNSNKKKSYQVDYTTKNITQLTKMQADTIDQVSTLLGKLMIH
jgi:hypothetical protein